MKIIHFKKNQKVVASKVFTVTGIGIRTEFVKVIKASLIVTAFSFRTFVAKAN